ncbi:MAG: hypothetical protein C0503_02895 [Gemmatimonas sp.]|nr:hypothetical protein [Gemmatimonas sp.]
MSGIAGKKALVKVTGAPLDFEDEACSTTDDTTYTIDDATKKYWDRDTAVQVFDDGVAVDPEVDPYRIIRLTGQVVFETADALRGPITVTGKYLPTSVAAGARAYSFTLEQPALDDTTFDDAGTDGHTRKIAGLKNVSGSISRRFRIESGMAAALIAGDPVILEFYADRAEAPDLVCWALLSKEGIQSSVDGTTDADVDWEGIPDADGVIIADTLA